MPLIRLNNPSVKIHWNVWYFGFSWAVFTNNGPRIASICFGPIYFSFCW